MTEVTHVRPKTPREVELERQLESALAAVEADTESLINCKGTP